MMNRRKTITWIIVAGVVLPAVTVAAVCALVLPGRRRRGDQLCCRCNLKMLAVSADLYVKMQGGRKYYPRRLEDLFDEKICDEPFDFRCPSDDHPMVTDSGLEMSCESVFDLVDEPLEAELPSRLIMIWDRKDNHRDGRNAVFFDTHADFMSEEEFQKLLAELKACLEAVQRGDDG